MSDVEKTLNLKRNMYMLNRLRKRRKFKKKYGLFKKFIFKFKKRNWNSYLNNIKYIEYFVSLLPFFYCIFTFFCLLPLEKNIDFFVVLSHFGLSLVVFIYKILFLSFNFEKDFESVFIFIMLVGLGLCPLSFIHYLFVHVHPNEWVFCLSILIFVIIYCLSIICVIFENFFVIICILIVLHIHNSIYFSMFGMITVIFLVISVGFSALFSVIFDDFMFNLQILFYFNTCVYYYFLLDQKFYKIINYIYA
ncbi:hypothetical protein TUBRATIS_009270 [Tubulinosema ratisbonensis]|uniref:Uncharacterized protein n=1 Tax=Tubulinosema ratisbonensis TaxID=291195 RepID=A0A437AMW1_9MICR|nr:hypothetical protein TUBRATIS_009270 [Tubulinosema ratisbonensis]